MPVTLFLVWAFYSACIFLHAGALVPDEEGFVHLAASMPFSEMVDRTPVMLYGSIFWVSLKLAGSADVARAAILLMFVSTPWLLLRTVSGTHLRVAVFLLWLSMPIAWWSGKLIAPEIPSMFLVALALYLFDRRQLTGVAIALAAAVAFKVSAVPTLVFFAIVFILDGKETGLEKLRMVPRLATAFLLTLFVLCPPTWAIVSEISKQPAHVAHVGLLEQAEEVLLAYRWEWDSVFSGGVMQFSLMPIPLALVAVGVLVRDWRMFAAAAITAFAYLYVNINSATAYWWYWIAYFPVFLYALSRVPQSAVFDRLPWHVVLYVAAAWNAVQQLPLIVDQAYQRFEQIRVLDKRDEVLACINQQLDEVKPASIYSMVEFGLGLSRDVPVYGIPGPDADKADVRLIGTRMLVDRRIVSGRWPEPGYLYATCGGVLIFTRQPPNRAP